MERPNRYIPSGSARDLGLYRTPVMPSTPTSLLARPRGARSPSPAAYHLQESSRIQRSHSSGAGSVRVSRRGLHAATHALTLHQPFLATQHVAQYRLVAQGPGLSAQACIPSRPPAPPDPRRTAGRRRSPRPPRPRLPLASERPASSSFARLRPPQSPRRRADPIRPSAHPAWL